jgi:hypothetical protein
MYDQLIDVQVERAARRRQDAKSGMLPRSVLAVVGIPESIRSYSLWSVFERPSHNAGGPESVYRTDRAAELLDGIIRRDVVIQEHGRCAVIVPMITDPILDPSQFVVFRERKKNPVSPESISQTFLRNDSEITQPSR